MTADILEFGVKSEDKKMRSCSNAIYGPRIKTNYQRLVQALAHRRFLPIGDGSNRRTLIYDRDVAKAALLAVQQPNAVGKVYNVSDGHFHTLKEIIVAICQALGRNPPRLSLPVGTVRLAAGILEDAGRMIGFKSPVQEEYNLKSQMQRAKLSMTNNISEGFGRYHYQENIQFCRQSRGSICELIDDFNECFDNKYIDKTYRDQLKNEAYRLIKVLNGYIASLKRQKAKALNDPIANHP